ncbi:glucose-6-phosphate translocase [Elysia marginata]|uniref:Glucose-6-phosphate translocase n=1 Tax=Elysia marginata TaxID=1093978 RepID=A0AAV4HDP6_9GAST|nr:glucose-6-phosphate translocase [Elysia marginata]
MINVSLNAPHFRCDHQQSTSRLYDSEDDGWSDGGCCFTESSALILSVPHWFDTRILHCAILIVIVVVVVAVAAAAAAAAAAVVVVVVVAVVVAAAAGTASSVLMFSVASFLCGFVQGPSWGACAVLLKQLVEPQQFATWWGILSVSTNVAGTVGPFLSAFCVESYGWRSAFVAVSTVTMVFSGLSFVVLQLFTSGDQKAKQTGALKINNDDNFCCFFFLETLVIAGV